MLEGPNRQRLESWLPSYLTERRWFTHKTRTVTSATVVDTVPVPGASNQRGASDGSPVAHLLIVQIELDLGPPERYLIPVAFLQGTEAEDMRKYHPDAVVADLQAGAVDGVLVDGVQSHAFVAAMTELLARRRVLSGAHGQLVGLPAPGLRQFDDCVRADCPTHPISGEQSNSSVMLDEQAIVKFIRRFEEGVNPGVEIGRFLSERAHFPHCSSSRRQHRVPHAERERSGTGRDGGRHRGVRAQ